MSFKIEERKITRKEYQFLRATTGWKMFEDKVIEKALKNDLYSICIFDEDKIIGIGRVIGDGEIYFYIQDVIVHPEYQGKKVGKMIMESIEDFLQNNSNKNSFIGLMAAKGVKDLYKKYGYTERAEDSPGMYKYIKK